ncbi:DNA polymerase II [Pseudoalteromonas rubra]|uniref:DNA polymerase n=1 Tax=Pseudoalteromonas rubra TaxID=43658 RepID=A0A5S3WKC3_9GAMM|nr:DNA polymerase II [Pseudoalteromonas rubra]TMP27297.1 DNA polymerase II [Pseudoalteromonas rubra]TMP36835.1 DNA polymerase II [Pseudoalteromonas rubra]
MAQAVYQGFILSRQQIHLNNRLHLCYWLKSAQGLLKVITESQQAVLFIRTADAEKARSRLAGVTSGVEFKPLTLKHLDQSPVTGLYCSTLSDFYHCKESLTDHVTLYEADIRHADRYLMERFIRGGAWISGHAVKKAGYTEIRQTRLKPSPQFVPKLSMLSLDIECSGEGVLFSVGLVTESQRLVIMIGEPEAAEVNVRWVADELSLLQALVEEVNRMDPDVIIGWNVIEFDCAVLNERAEALGVSLSIGRDGTPMQVSKGNFTRVLIAGRVVLDGIDTMKNATYHFETFKLAYVAQQVLGTSKLIEQDDRLDAIIRLFHKDKPALASYNLQDCVLVWDIFTKLSLLEFAIARTQLTGLELERMGGSVAAFTNLYLPLLHRSGYIAPNLGEHGLTFDSPGGYVMDSRPGLYQNVLVLDFKSLYPSIIRTFHIDPMGLIEGLKSPQDAIPGFNKGAFSRTRHHLPKLVAQLAQARQEAKDRGEKMLQQAIKIIMNSLYGVLGSRGCRFYDPRLSSSITLRGHEIMQTTRGWIEEMGYEVIYGDTDSTFVCVPDSLSAAQCQQLGKSLMREINLRWAKHIECHFNLPNYLEIEFETHYSPFFMPTIRGQETGSKKRYVGQIQTEQGSELVFKGLETVRSDWTEIAKEYQQAVIRALFDGLDVVSVTEQYIALINSGQADNKLIYKKRLGKPLNAYVKNIPPHVRAAKEAHSQGINRALSKGSQVAYYISRSGPKLVSGALVNPDYSHYIEKQILPIYQMLPDIDLEAITLHGQRTLDLSSDL